jgi:ribose-phosphate pyrophosphokinase
VGWLAPDPTAPQERALTACLIALPGAEGCARRLAAALRLPCCRLDSRRFPDGETYLRVLDPVAGCDVWVVAQLREPDPQLPALLFLADALRELGAARVGLVAPYLPYMRQDMRFHAGETVTSRSLANWIDARFDGLVTVDPHLHRIATLDAIYRLRSLVVPSAPAIAAWLREHVAQPHLVGPDEESRQWVAEVARLAGCDFTVLQKRRRGNLDVEVSLPQPQDWQGRTPVLVDDIISSAHTMADVVRQLRAAGLKAPVCIGVHAIFAAGAQALLQQAGAARVVTCNTLEHASNGIDLSAALAAGVRELLDPQA